jgi:hypothetical protein
MKTPNSTLATMKIIYTTLILAFLILMSSCNITKRSMREIKENNYYHDSTIVQEKLTVQPVFVPADTTYASVLLKDLLLKGKFKSTDRHYTTTIEYRDSTIFVETTSDSVLLLLSQYEKTLKRFTTQINEKSELTENQKKKGISIPAVLWFIALLVVLCLILWLWSRKKS